MWPKMGENYANVTKIGGKLCKCDQNWAKYALNLSDAGLGICSISIFYSIWSTNNEKCSVELVQSRWVTIPKSDRCASSQFMKAIKITNVNLVAEHFLEQIIWKHTFAQAIKIINVILVVNRFLKQEVWRYTSTQFTRVIEIINLTLVANHFLKQEVWRTT